MLLGYVQDIVTNAVITHPELGIETKGAVLRAVNKVNASSSVHTHTLSKYGWKPVTY